MASRTRCVNCNGELVFVPEKGVLRCDRCGSEFHITSAGNKPLVRIYSATYYPEDNVTEAQYQCTFCGAKTIVGDDELLKRCPSCGNTTLKRMTSSTHAPDGLVPFKITRTSAAEIFRRWVSNRKFAPNDLKHMAKLEKISGIYVPAWNFNFTAIWNYRGIGVKRSTDSDGIEDTTEYPVNKNEEQKYKDKIFSASTRVSDDFIQDLGPFDLSKMVPYSTEYLLGFTGIDTNKDIHKIYGAMTKDIADTNERHARERFNANYDRVDNFASKTTFKNVYFSYTYVPIWANHYTYKGKEYHCYINGQTGKATGKAPKSAAKIFSLLLGIGALVAAAVLIILKCL